MDGAAVTLLVGSNYYRAVLSCLSVILLPAAEFVTLVNVKRMLSMSMSIAIFSVAQIVKLLQSPRKRVR